MPPSPSAAVDRLIRDLAGALAESIAGEYGAAVRLYADGALAARMRQVREMVEELEEELEACSCPCKCR